MFVAGTHDFGTIDQYQQTSVATRFVHVWFVPIWPLRSIVKSSLGTPFVVPFVARSIVAGYLRVWGPVLVGIVVLDLLTRELALPLAINAVVATLGLIAGAIGWMMGRLDRRGYAERHAYRLAIGLPVDPAILSEDDRRSTRAKLLEELGRKHVDYRGAMAVPWERLAIESDVESLATLLALARVEETFSGSAERARLRSKRKRLGDILLSKLGV